MPFKILSKTELFKGKFKSLWETRYLDKAGNEHVWEWMDKKDFVLVLAITKEKKIVMLKHYRIPVENYCYELPAGHIDSTDKNHEDTARRELLEETGYTAEKFIPLRWYYNSAGNMKNIAFPYVALNAERINKNSGDITEDIEVVEILEEELYEFYQKCPPDYNFNPVSIGLYEIAKKQNLI